MTAQRVLSELSKRGVTLQTTERGTLRFHPAEAVTPELKEAIKQHKASLLALLEPQRTADTGNCPEHWQHIPLLPAKDLKVTTQDDEGKGRRYRVCLFGVWYLLSYRPTISTEHFEAVDEQRTRRMFANLEELYLFTWALNFQTGLRTVN